MNSVDIEYIKKSNFDFTKEELDILNDYDKAKKIIATKKSEITISTIIYYGDLNIDENDSLPIYNIKYITGKLNYSKRRMEGFDNLQEVNGLYITNTNLLKGCLDNLNNINTFYYRVNDGSIEDIKYIIELTKPRSIKIFDMPNIDGIYIPNNVDTLEVDSDDISGLIFEPGVKQLELTTGNITKLNLPEGIENLKLRVKNKEEKLKKLVFPDSIKQLEIYSENIIRSLDGVVFSKSLRKLYSTSIYSFKGATFKEGITELKIICPRVEALRLPESLRKLEYHTILFNAQSNIFHNVVLPKNLLEFKTNTGYIDNVVLPESLRKIDFRDVIILSNVIFPETLDELKMNYLTNVSFVKLPYRLNNNFEKIYIDDSLDAENFFVPEEFIKYLDNYENNKDKFTVIKSKVKKYVK